jgi:3-dehydroquinate dehydratase II
MSCLHALHVGASTAAPLAQYPAARSRSIRRPPEATPAKDHLPVPASRLVYVLNGPNLNLLGQRQPHIYGHETLADVEASCRKIGEELSLEIAFHQSNAEHELIGWIHEARTRAGGIVVNPAAYSHTSVAILDALSACEFPVMEVHISNIHRREAFRHHSYVSAVAAGVIAGFGTEGYGFALRRLATLIDAA